MQTLRHEELFLQLSEFLPKEMLLNGTFVSKVVKSQGYEAP